MYDLPVDSYRHAASDRAASWSSLPANRLASLPRPEVPAPHRSSLKVKPMRAAC